MFPVVERMLESFQELSFELWLTKHSFAVEGLVSGRVTRVLREAQVDDHEIEKLDPQAYRFVLTGTSIDGNIESAVTRRARQQRVPVFAILDHWSEYGRRFGEQEGELTAVPDVVFVPDGRARDDLARLGVPDDRLIVSGHPAFDRLAEVRSRFSDEVQRMVLKDLDVPESPGIAVFVSEPVSADHADKRLNYSEFSVLRSILMALRLLPSDVRPCLILKLHPREGQGKFAAVLREFPDVKAKAAPPSIDRYTLLMASNVVLGIDSIMLLEASVLGAKAFSVQVGYTDDGCIGAHTGQVQLIRDAGTLGDLLRKPRQPLGTSPDSTVNASQRIMERVLTCTGITRMSSAASN